MAMFKQFDKTDELLTVTLSCQINKKLDVSIDQRHHNHDLNFLNEIKTNSVLKITASNEIAKKYTPSAMNRNMQGVEWADNLQALQQAEGKNFNVQTMYNARRSFKKKHPDARKSEARNDWIDQSNECAKTLQALRENILIAQLK